MSRGAAIVTGVAAWLLSLAWATTFDVAGDDRVRLLAIWAVVSAVLVAGVVLVVRTGSRAMRRFAARWER